MIAFLHARREKFREHLSALPTTNLRIYITLVMTVLTGLVYLGLAVARLFLLAAGKPVGDAPLWEPSWEWLAFIAALSGIDFAQYTAKRMTQDEYVKAQAQARVSQTPVDAG